MVEKKEHRPVSLRSEVYEQFREFQSKIRYEELRGANLSLSDTLVFLMNAYEELTTTKEGETELAAMQKDIAAIRLILVREEEEEEEPSSIEVSNDVGEILSRFKGNNN